MFLMEEVYLCTPVPQTGWKYHFIFHVWVDVFEETTCVVTSCQLETSEFCFVIFFPIFLTCLMEMKLLFLSAGGKHTHSIMDLMLTFV